MRSVRALKLPLGHRKHTYHPVMHALQGRQEDLRSVVTSLKATFGVDYIYCWHGLPAYWSGISLEVLCAPCASHKRLAAGAWRFSLGPLASAAYACHPCQ